MTYYIRLLFIFLGCLVSTVTLADIIRNNLSITGNASQTTVTATGGNTAITLADRAAQLFNARDYGAVGDGSSHALSTITTFNGQNTTGWTLGQWQAVFPTATALSNQIDGVAINAMFAAATATVEVGGQKPIQIVIPKGYYLANVSLNMTGFRGIAIDVSAYGAVIASSVTGKIAVDGLNTQRMTVRGLTIVGDATNKPSFGLVIGRIDTTANNSSDDLRLVDVHLDGSFSTCGLLELNSETTKFDKLFANNNANANTVCLDGINHYGNVSAQISQYVTLSQPADTAQSFNDLTISDSDIRGAGGGSPIWAAHIAHAKISSYLAQLSGTPGFTFYQISGGDSSNVDVDIHGESGTFLNYMFYLTGTETAATFNGFRFNDHSNQASVALFKVDGGSSISSVTMTDADIHVDNFSGGAGVKLFADPSLWALQGKVYLPAYSNWSAPAVSQTSLCVATQCWNYAPTQVMNRNPDFDIDQPFARNTTGSFLVDNGIVTDGWHATIDGGGGLRGKVSHQSTSTNNYPGDAFDLATTVNTPASPSAAQYYAIRTMIESTDSAPLQWGSATATAMIEDFCAWSSLTGTYTGYVQNNGSTRSYVFEYAIPTANTWFCFSKTIPGDTTGTWGSSTSTIGIFAGFNLGAGSNSQATANTWSAGDFKTTSNAVNFYNTNGAVLRLAAVHIYPVPVDMLYAKRTVDQEFTKSQRYYNKSFPIATQPAQNASIHATGAVTLISPFAQVTSTAAGAWVSYPQEMFMNNQTTAPTITFYSTNVASANCYDSTQAADAGAASAVNGSSKGFFLKCTLAVGDLLGDQLQAHYAVDSGF